MGHLSSTWRRARRPLAWMLGIALVLYLAVLFFAWLGVTFPGSTSTQQVNPPDATRNLLDVTAAVLRTYAVLAVQFVTLPFIIVAQFALLFWFLARGTTYTIFPGEYDVSFDDVRGQPHVVASTREVMRIFQGYKDFRRLGGHPPRGVLFEGPPGTGKTLLAKAIAGETGVPFLYASGAGFANMFVGVPQLKVRSMFRKARRYSERWGGCVIFIDELDSIGGARAASLASGNASVVSRFQRYVMPGGMSGGTNLVNALLTEIDGVDRPPAVQRWFRRHLGMPPAEVRSHNLLVIGATNLAGTLDAALLRPGRFDRRMHVGLPARAGRIDIISHYLSRVNHEPVDVEQVARITEGYSPAALRNLVNEALIVALQDGRDALRSDDMWTAFVTNEAGLAEEVTYDPAVKRAIAVHETGHAIACHFLAPHRSVTLITVRKRQGSLGIHFGVADGETFGARRSEIVADIQVALAGMVAEEIWVGETSTGPGSDLEAASRQALMMVAQLGMGEENLLTRGVLGGGASPADALAGALTDSRLRDEANAILRRCKDEVRALLLDRRAAVEAVCEALVQRDEITGDEFRAILFDHGALAERPNGARGVPVAPRTQRNRS